VSPVESGRGLRKGGGSLSCFRPPRRRCKPARSAVMVFVLAWLSLAIDADLYYPAGSQFITAPLLCGENFFFSLRAYYPRLPKESSRAEPLYDVTFLKWAEHATQAHLGKQNIDLTWFSGSEWIENVCCYLRIENAEGNVLIAVYLFICMRVIRVTKKVVNRIAWNLVGWLVIIRGPFD